MKKIDYYFDFLSPYSYLSWNWLRKEHPRLKSEGWLVNFKPVALATIIKHYKTLGPAEIEPKRNYLFKDCLRYSKENNIAFNPPPQLPFNSLYALRMSLLENARDNQFKIIDSFFMNGWGRGLDIGNPEVLVRLLDELDLDGAKYLDNVSDKEIRRALKTNNQNALADGVFGLPSFIVENEKKQKELFWGNDSIRYLAPFLKGDDLVNHGAYNSFVDSYLV